MTGILYHCSLVDPLEFECFEHQGQHKAQCRQRRLLHRLLRRLHRLATALETFATILFWSGDCNCDLVPPYRSHWDMVGLMHDGESEARCQTCYTFRVFRNERPYDESGFDG